MKKRSLLIGILLCGLTVAILGCGQNFYFAGRNLPPSGVINRVLISISNPGALATGSITFVDAYYDIRHPYNNSATNFSIAGASANLPLTIQNMPEEQLGAVYNAGSGSLSLINYAQEKQATSVAGSLAANVFISRNQQYVLSADQSAHYLVINDRVLGRSFSLNLPGVYRVSLNPGATLGLAFVQNSDIAYSLVHLSADQQQQASLSSDPQHYQPPGALQPAQDCEPQSLPVYCVFPITTTSGATFSRPVKALFSSDGTTAYVLNCGPECGGTQSGFTTIPITTSSLNTPSEGPSGLNLQTQTSYPIPGGASNAIITSTTMYLAGQSFAIPGQSGATSTFLSGYLTVFNLSTGQVAGSFSIADGSHTKMLFADDNTLFIGSLQCQLGYRYAQNPNDGSGCLTMFNTSTNAVSLDTYKGDLTGIADVEGLHKIYVAEGGQVYIYRTTDFSELDNSNVSVVGTATDVAYMDGTSDSNNTNY